MCSHSSLILTELHLKYHVTPLPLERRQTGTGGWGGRGEKKHGWNPQPSPLPHTSSLGYFWETVLHGSFFFKEIF